MLVGGDPADVDLQGGALLGLGDQVVAELVGQTDGLFGLWAGGRVEGGQDDFSVGRGTRRGHRRHPGGVGGGGQEPVEGGRVGGRGHLAGELERPVEPGSESVGQRRVGLVGGRRGRVGAGVGRAEPQAEDGQGEDDHDAQGGDRDELLAGFDEFRPSQPEAGGVRRCACRRARAARSRRERTLGPTKPSMAGRKVREVAMVKATAMAEEMDRP